MGKEKIGQEAELGVALQERTRTQRPKMYRVQLHNDDFTPFDFVISIVIEVFHKSREEAVFITLSVHHRGRGECGVFPKHIAESKVDKVMRKAKAAGHPLLCTMESID